MARMRGRGEPGSTRQREKQKSSLEAVAKEPAKGGSGKGMDRSSRLVVTGLMGGLLALFLLIGVLAPDSWDPEGRPGGSTILWRLLFLLIPLAVMYGLLWGESFLELLKSSRARRKP